MTNRVLLRAASGKTVGMGHVMRTRSIAQEILLRGGEPVLIVDDKETAIALETDDFRVFFEEEIPDWMALEASAALLDGFVDWTPELEMLARLGTPTFLVENRSPARDRCDHLVYPALHYVPDEWDAEHAERILAGPSWIPLAKEVRGVRPSVERDVDLLITFGGSDPWQLTERVLGVLDGSDLSIVVAVGPHMADRRESIEACAENYPNVQVLLPGMPLARWFARSRAALTAVGTTLYELAYLGVPALVLANYAEDHDALDWYAEHGPHLPLGVAAELSQEGLRAAITSGLRELETRTAPQIAGLGEGATRLADSLLNAA